MPEEKWPEIAERLISTLLSQAGATPPAQRRAAYARAQSLARNAEPTDGLEPPFAAFVDAVATKPGNADVEGLLTSKHSEDTVFELVLSAALGAGMVRFEEGLRTLKGGSR